MNTINKAAYEGDIASRLRNWRGLHLAHSGRLYEEAADEIERLRNGATEGRETVQQEPAAWAVTMGDGSAYEAFAAHQRGEAEVLANECRFGNKSLPLPLAPLYLRPQPTLTAEEREAIWTVAEAYAENDGDPDCERIARIMQGLWQRTK